MNTHNIHDETIQGSRFVQSDGDQIHISLSPEQARAASKVKAGDEFDIEIPTGELWWGTLTRRIDFPCGNAVFVITPCSGGAWGAAS